MAIPFTLRARRVTLAALSVTGLALALPVAAQTWPSKPVTLVVGTPAGGAVDVYARALALHLGKVTGGNFLVDNRAGANGNISAEYVLKTPADGATLWIGTHAMVTINPSAYPNLRWKQSDFAPIAKGVEAPLMLVTNAGVPAKTFPDLIKWVQANPGKGAYASFSPGTPSQFLGFQLNEKLKLDMVHVPYKGSAPQVVDLVAGQAPLGFTQIQTALPHVQSGKLNAIAVTSEKRSRFAPQVPTLAELGHADMNTSVWFGLFAPAATPRPVLDAIRAATQKVQADADYRKHLEASGFDVSSEQGEAFAKAITAETARWAQVVRATGFKAND